MTMCDTPRTPRTTLTMSEADRAAATGAGAALREVERQLLGGQVVVDVGAGGGSCPRQQRGARGQPQVGEDPLDRLPLRDGGEDAEANAKERRMSVAQSTRGVAA